MSKKIMFSDKYGLTQAVLDGRKTMTRRNLTLTLHKESNSGLVEVFPDKIFFEDNKWKFNYDDYTFILPKKNYPKYKVGEVVAIAQSYESIYNKKGLETMDMFVSGLKNHKGWQNKLFVAASEMIHHIRITDVKVERLQDISDEHCLREGINASNSHEIGYGIPWVYEFAKSKMVYLTPREAFAALIDCIYGKGTWDKNPFVFSYGFELVD